MVQWLTQLSQLVCLNEEVPADWRTQLIVLLHKNVSYDDCDNFRALPYSVFQERSFAGFF